MNLVILKRVWGQVLWCHCGYLCVISALLSPNYDPNMSSLNYSAIFLIHKAMCFGDRSVNARPITLEIVMTSITPISLVYLNIQVDGCHLTSVMHSFLLIMIRGLYEVLSCLFASGVCLYESITGSWINFVTSWPAAPTHSQHILVRTMSLWEKWWAKTTTSLQTLILKG